jgi:redox-sensitive bicupin YhaK (pirin superfamily)
VPGFPQHPHRGFETVTIVRRGLVDHSDSLGAAARFGGGDVQWLTAGHGIVHSEMFPLLRRERDNPLELFQIWLNLPAADKHAPPHFSMLWGDRLPRVEQVDALGRKGELVVVAGALGSSAPPSPPPRSWASRTDTDVAIATLRLEPGASYTLPPARSEEAVRVLYFFAGDAVTVGDHVARDHAGLVVRCDRELTVRAGEHACELLLLQGVPIGEPVAQHGPFVMNTRLEIERAFEDYRRTRFGGWPWDRDDPVHPREAGRFARHADGRREEP